MNAYIFPGQGSQFPGMGQDLTSTPKAEGLFGRANDLLGFPLTDIMFTGTKEELTRTDAVDPQSRQPIAIEGFKFQSRFVGFYGFIESFELIEEERPRA